MPRQGEQVKIKEHDTTTPHELKVLAILARMIGGLGVGRRSPGVRRYVTLASLATVLAAAAAAAAIVSIAAAAGSINVEPINVKIARSELFSTRARLEAGVTADIGTEFTWRLEYATSKEVLEQGKGILAATGAATMAGPSEGALALVRALAPGTHYYARFLVESPTAGKASASTEFTMLPIGAPEIEGCPFAGAEFESCTFSAVANPKQAGEFEIGTDFATFEATIDGNGAQSTYRFESASTEGGPWTLVPGCGGSITTAKEFVKAECHLTELKPETTYFLRVAAENEKDEGHPVVETKSFKTQPDRPTAGNLSTAADVTESSAFLYGNFKPHRSETHWRFEYSPAEAGHAPPEGSPAWTVGPGGTIAAAETDEGSSYVGPARISGLTPGTVYFVRLFAENEHGKLDSAETPITSFETAGPPTAATFSVHALHGEAVRVLGAVQPHVKPVNDLQTVSVGGGATGGSFTLSFAGHTTGPILFNGPRPTALEVQSALQALPNVGEHGVNVYFTFGDSYSVEFVGALGGAEQPLLTADPSGLTPAGTVTLQSAQKGFSYDTRYHFDYVSDEQFAKEGFANATAAAEVDLGGVSAASELVGEDLPGLEAGKTYHFRIAATNTTAGNPSAQGGEQTLQAPSPAPPGPECPAAQVPTASLPDCRAYEQVTPANKEATEEMTGKAFNGGPQVGADGDHFAAFVLITRWGSGSPPYFFTRTPSGWQMTAGAPASEAGVSTYQPQVWDPNLTQFAFQSSWLTGNFSSPTREFRAGPAGGPYSTAATIAAKQVGGEAGWRGASHDFTHLILQAEDRTLISGEGGEPTGTKSGKDVFEYAEGQLRQVNVDSAGKTIGTCGAKLATGSGGYSTLTARYNPVSADGARVFFEAVPASNCAEPAHLYMRVNHAETRDLGAYTFLAANSQGTLLMLSGPNGGFFLYDTGSGEAKLMFTVHEQVEPQVSDDFTAVYFRSAEQLTADAPAGGEAAEYIRNGSGTEDLYRYDIPTATLHFVVQAQSGEGTGERKPAGGRYYYFLSRGVGGLPGGDPTAESDHRTQLYRYDSAENSVQCVSCASPFDPVPKLGLRNTDGEESLNVFAPYTSANGDYAFFATPAALVAQDHNGEEPPNGGGEYSPSSDVYEWRRDGLHGCTHLQGCLSLISPGTEGGLVALIGVAHEGRDVFFTTRSRLVPSDKDSALDVYDAREGGGFPPPPPVQECEGATCQSQPAAPVDTTPASLAFSGPGNLLSAPSAPPGVKPKVKPCRRALVRRHGRCVKARRHARRRARRAGTRSAGGSR
jgi:hypothetical protein